MLPTFDFLVFVVVLFKLKMEKHFNAKNAG
jgi:hypothetical protein